MSDPLSYFEDVENVSAEVVRSTTEIIKGIEQPPVTASIVTLDVIFYVGSQAEQMVSEKIRQSVDAVLLTDPSTDIILNDTVIIEGQPKTFQVINSEDVAEQGELLVIALKRLD